MPDQTPVETRKVSLNVITPGGDMTHESGRLPLPEARDLVARALEVGPGEMQFVLVVPRPRRDPRVVVRSSADADAVAGLVATVSGDL